VKYALGSSIVVAAAAGACPALRGRAVEAEVVATSIVAISIVSIATRFAENL
jgi:hypothetical protein